MVFLFFVSNFILLTPVPNFGEARHTASKVEQTSAVAMLHCVPECAELWTSDLTFYE
jgi:hypothetical protein